MSDRLHRAAQTCEQRILMGKRARLDSADADGMIIEMRADGAEVDDQNGPAWLARRYLIWEQIKRDETDK